MPVVARMRLHYIGILVAFYASIANASPVDQNNVVVLDGDTIWIAGETFRLIGFDAPETYQARCPSESESGIERHSGFASSSLEVTSILSEWRALAAPGPKEHRAAIMAVRAVS